LGLAPKQHKDKSKTSSRSTNSTSSTSKGATNQWIGVTDE
jgi:hypothetical protein